MRRNVEGARPVSWAPVVLVSASALLGVLAGETGADERADRIVRAFFESPGVVLVSKGGRSVLRLGPGLDLVAWKEKLKKLRAEVRNGMMISRNATGIVAVQKQGQEWTVTYSIGDKEAGTVHPLNGGSADVVLPARKLGEHYIGLALAGDGEDTPPGEGGRAGAGGNANVELGNDADRQFAIAMAGDAGVSGFNSEGRIGGDSVVSVPSHDPGVDRGHGYWACGGKGGDAGRSSLLVPLVPRERAASGGPGGQTEVFDLSNSSQAWLLGGDGGDGGEPLDVRVLDRFGTGIPAAPPQDGGDGGGAGLAHVSMRINVEEGSSAHVVGGRGGNGAKGGSGGAFVFWDLEIHVPGADGGRGGDRGEIRLQAVDRNLFHMLDIRKGGDGGDGGAGCPGGNPGESGAGGKVWFFHSVNGTLDQLAEEEEGDPGLPGENLCD
ncbi:MAG: hypothetical protein HY720_14680 [Planctomycetes bacterium]|nr:hypothetical protein [Planctomycetota bacterium]